MKSTTLFLLVSVALNVAFAAHVLIRSTAPPRESIASLSPDASAGARDRDPALATPEAESASSAAARAPASAASLPWTQGNATAILSRLKADGAPETLRMMVAHYFVGEALKSEREQIFGTSSRYLWQHGITSHRPTPEQREKLNALDLRREEMVMAIMGSDYLDARFANYYDDPRLAGIPREKLTAIALIQSDYDAARREAMRAGDPRSRAATSREVDVQRDAEIKAALTPSEYERYMLYRSSEAIELQQGLAGADVTDDQYIAIYNQVRALPQQSGPGFGIQINAVVDVIESQAGADAALQYARRDGSVAQTIDVFKSSGLASAEILQRRRLIIEALSSRDADTPEERNGRLAQTYQAVTAGLSAEARTAFDQTPQGRQLLRTPSRPPLPR